VPPPLLRAADESGRMDGHWMQREGAAAASFAAGHQRGGSFTQRDDDQRDHERMHDDLENMVFWSNNPVMSWIQNEQEFGIVYLNELLGDGSNQSSVTDDGVG
jgi:hypothetical protein